MTKPTAGPWIWEGVKTDGSVPEFTLKGPDVLCRYWYDKPPSADAALIAAAPALYEALSECEAMLTVLATAYGEDEHEGVKRCVNAGRAALATARQQEG